MSYQNGKRTKSNRSYSSKSRIEKKESFRPYNRSKKDSKKSVETKNKCAKPKFNKPVKKIDAKTIISTSVDETLWISTAIKMTRFLKRVSENDALTIAKLIVKNPGLFITNLNNDIKVEQIFNVQLVKNYIKKHWSYHKYKKGNKFIQIVKLTNGYYRLNLNISELFRLHQFYKLTSNEITRSMILKVSSFDEATFTLSKTLFGYGPTLSPLNNYILFWNDKKLIDLVTDSNNPANYITLSAAIEKDIDYGKFKVKELPIKRRNR